MSLFGGCAASVGCDRELLSPAGGWLEGEAGMVSLLVPSGEVAGEQMVTFAAFFAFFEAGGVAGFDLPNTNPAPESASSDLHAQVCCISEGSARGV